MLASYRGAPPSGTMVPWAVAQSFSTPSFTRENIAATHGLRFSGVEHTGPRDQGFTLGGSQVVDLVFRGDHAQARQRAAAGIGQGVVGQVADGAAVDEAVLLQVVAAHGQPQFGPTGFEGGQLRTEQKAEGLCGQDAPAERKQIGFSGHDGEGL
jgi:hypothetical protein